MQVFWRLISPWDELGTDLHQQQTSSEEPFYPFYTGHLLELLSDPLPIQCTLFLKFQDFSQILGLQYRSGGVPAIHMSQTAAIVMQKMV